MLGPLLFLLYINDLPSVVQSYTKIFADDTKLFRAIKDEYDSEIYQNDLSRTWQINFNITKCKVPHLGKKNQQEIYLMHQNDKTVLSPIENVTEHPDLGALMDTSLSFHKHISSIILKANKILATIKRSFKYLTEQTFPFLYKSLVRPHLEYCNAVLSPHLIKHVKAIKAVQRRATKSIPSLRSLSYEDRLKKVKLANFGADEEICYRRRRGDMLLVYKLMNKLTKCDWESFFKRSDYPTGGHKDKLYKPMAKTTLRLNTSSNRIINEWNSLPSEVISAQDINDFKNKYDNISGQRKFII